MKDFIKLTPHNVGIIGGKALPEAERGPMDTDPDKSHPLYDERLKTVKMSPEWLASIKVDGVLTAPEIAKIGDNYFVVAGRQRVRAARVVSPDVAVYFRVVPYEAKDAIGHMVLENVRHDDTTAVKIAKLKRLMEHGFTIEEAAGKFAIKLGTAKMWLAYDETAIKEVKDAVNKNQIPSTVGMDIARLGDADKQQKALTAVLGIAKKDSDKAPKRGGQGTKVKRTISRAANPDKSPGITDKKTLLRFLEAVEAKEQPKDAKPITLEWWAGVEAALHLVAGNDGADKRLLTILDKLDEEPTPEASKEPKSTPGKDKTPKAKKAPKVTPPDDDNDE